MKSGATSAKKRRDVRGSDSPELGDQWVYVAIDAETKLVPSFRIGKRVRTDTWAFLWNLNKRTQTPFRSPRMG